jgi:isopentenyldiphosphate isomerase
MGFLRHIQACNNHSSAGFLPFWVGDHQVGLVRQDFARTLEQWPDLFKLTDTALTLSPALHSFEERSQAVAGILPQLVEQGVITHLHGEQYAVTPTTPENGVMLIDRAAAPYFGVRAFGQHINGLVREGGELKLWVARRASDRRHYPGRLDNLVAGGLPHGISREDNLIKECWEEAGIPTNIALRACPASVISYRADMATGFKPDTLYCYDLELPGDFVPRCMDGEVEAFYLWPVEEVRSIVRDTDEFKLNCNLVVIDFMIRHGYIGPEDPHYYELLDSLAPAVDSEALA